MCIAACAVLFLLIHLDDREAERRERRAVETIRRMAEDEKIVFLEDQRRGVR